MDKKERKQKGIAKRIKIWLVVLLVPTLYVGSYLMLRTYAQHRWATIPGTIGTVSIGYGVAGDTIGYSDVVSNRVFKAGGGWNYQRYGKNKGGLVKYLPLVYRPLEFLEVSFRGLGGKSKVYWRDSR